MIDAFVSRLERAPLTVAGFLAGFSGLIFVRFFLETLSSPIIGNHLPVDAVTLVHYGLFFLAAYLVLALIIGTFTKEQKEANTLLLFGFIIIWLPPVIDLLVTGGAGRTLAYLFVSPSELVPHLIAFFGPVGTGGVTLGIRIEIVIALVSIAWYVYRARRSLLAAAAAAAASYIALFVLLALPSIIYAIAVLFGAPGASIVSFLEIAIVQSGLLTNVVPGNLISVSPFAAFGTGFSALMSVIFVPLIAGLCLLMFRRLDPGSFNAHARNIRPERLLHYLAILAFGAWFGLGAGSVAHAWSDVLGFVSLIIAFSAAWIFAVATNDMADETIDAISNAGRPLIVKAVTREQMREIACVALIASLAAAWAAGLYPFFFVLVFTACYFVYSVPPLRLKRVPFLSSLIIGLISLSVALAGFFFTSSEKSLSAASPLLMLGVVVMYTLAAHVRDLKDIDGDKAAGVYTVPVLVSVRFGRAAAHQFTGALLALAFLLSPLFFPVPGLWYLAVPAALLGYLACMRTPYDERYIFLIYFGYLAAAALLSFA